MVILGENNTGKLSNLWNELKNLPENDPRTPIIQHDINEIEKWMITQGIKLDTITKWHNNIISPLYPHHTGFVDYDDLSFCGEFNGKHINYNKDKSIHSCELCSNI